MCCSSWSVVLLGTSIPWRLPSNEEHTHTHLSNYSLFMPHFLETQVGVLHNSTTTDGWTTQGTEKRTTTTMLTHNSLSLGDNEHSATHYLNQEDVELKWIL